MVQVKVHMAGLMNTVLPVGDAQTDPVLHLLLLTAQKVPLM